MYHTPNREILSSLGVQMPVGRFVGLLSNVEHVPVILNYSNIESGALLPVGAIMIPVQYLCLASDGFQFKG